MKCRGCGKEEMCNGDGFCFHCASEIKIHSRCKRCGKECVSLDNGMCLDCQIDGNVEW